MEELTNLINKAISFGLQEEVLEAFIQNLLQQIRDNKNEPMKFIDYQRAIEYAALEWDI